MSKYSKVELIRKSLWRMLGVWFFVLLMIGWAGLSFWEVTNEICSVWDDALLANAWWLYIGAVVCTLLASLLIGYLVFFGHKPLWRLLREIAAETMTILTALKRIIFGNY